MLVKCTDSPYDHVFAVGVHIVMNKHSGDTFRSVVRNTDFDRSQQRLDTWQDGFRRSHDHVSISTMITHQLPGCWLNTHFESILNWMLQFERLENSLICVWMCVFYTGIFTLRYYIYMVDPYGIPSIFCCWGVCVCLLDRVLGDHIAFSTLLWIYVFELLIITQS